MKVKRGFNNCHYLKMRMSILLEIVLKVKKCLLYKKVCFFGEHKLSKNHLKLSKDIRN